MSCLGIFLLIPLAVLVMMTLLRWFEQTAEAVDRGWWVKLALLLVAPYTVWCFRSAVASGRPIPVARHEPVRGFGTAPALGAGQAPPVMPPKKPRAAVDPEQVAKLRQKMKDQGMFGGGQ